MIVSTLFFFFFLTWWKITLRFSLIYRVKYYVTCKQHNGGPISHDQHTPPTPLQRQPSETKELDRVNKVLQSLRNRSLADAFHLAHDLVVFPAYKTSLLSGFFLCLSRCLDRIIYMRAWKGVAAWSEGAVWRLDRCGNNSWFVF